MGGGGGGSGKVGYAGYIEDAHTLMIYGVNGADTYANDLLSASVTMAVNNPYGTAVAYNPDTALAAMVAGIDVFDAIADDLVDDAVITAEVTAFDAEATNRLNTEVIPKFNTLMRDICAVQSSTFVMGRASLLEAKERDVNSYSGKLKLEWKRLYLQAKKDVLTMTVDVERMRIATKHDEEMRDQDIAVADVSWEVDTLIKSGQFLGILGGGSMIPDKPNKGMSAVSGGLAGAAAGAYVGSVVPGIGTAVGAVAGGLLGAGAAFM